VSCVYVINMNEFDATTSLIRETLAVWQSITITANGEGGAGGAEAAASRATYGEKHGAVLFVNFVSLPAAPLVFAEAFGDTARVSQSSKLWSRISLEESVLHSAMCAIEPARLVAIAARGADGLVAVRCGRAQSRAPEECGGAQVHAAAVAGIGLRPRLGRIATPALAVTQRSLARSLPSQLTEFHNAPSPLCRYLAGSG
jgi:hypothetical protein